MKLFLFSLLFLFCFLGFIFYKDTQYRKKKLTDVLGDEVKKELEDEMRELQSRKEKFEKTLREVRKKSDTY